VNKVKKEIKVNQELLLIQELLDHKVNEVIKETKVIQVQKDYQGMTV